MSILDFKPTIVKDMSVTYEQMILNHLGSLTKECKNEIVDKACIVVQATNGVQCYTPLDIGSYELLGMLEFVKATVIECSHYED